MSLKHEGVLLIIAVVVFSHPKHLKTEAGIQSFRDIIALPHFQCRIARAVVVGMAQYFDEELLSEAARPVRRMNR